MGFFPGRIFIVQVFFFYLLACLLLVLAIQGFLCSHMNRKVVFFPISVMNCIGIFIEVALNLQICVWKGSHFHSNSTNHGIKGLVTFSAFSIAFFGFGISLYNRSFASLVRLFQEKF